MASSPEDGRDMFLRNVIEFKRTARRYIFEESVLFLSSIYQFEGYLIKLPVSQSVCSGER
jgi:hypothetical protein